MFKKILVANRGEIALRVVRACRDLGVPAVAVYSDVDRVSSHVRYADEAYCIGPADARQSYLDGDKIIEVARQCGADAIHPGYGFLAENADFAEACYHAGITFIGPSPQAIRKLGDKVAARELMIDAGVPVVPGSGELTSIEETVAMAEQVGYPVMIKASAGGGGRGIRVVERPEDLAAAADRAMYEAQTWFRNPAIYLERRLTGVRHVEIQIMADRYGNIVSLGERECSIQRRNQKIIEESPSTAVTWELRRAMGRAAERAARAAGYYGVGTVEFLLDDKGEFYFLEMNTRLQVEHPVTELVSGVDLVKDQILVGSGEELAYEARDVPFRGWAIEARIVAEDPYNNFLPSVGRVVLAREPSGPGIRVESALYHGMEVTPYYDSLLAKVTAWGRDREEARIRLLRALAETRVIGVSTNIPYLRTILRTEEFIEGRIDTAFLDTHMIAPPDPREEEMEAAEIGALLFTLISNEKNGSANNGHAKPGSATSWRQTMGNRAAWSGSGRW